MSTILPHQIHLLDQVDLFLNAPGAASQPAVEPDGYIYYHLHGMAEQSIQGRASFNVFWGTLRNSRQYFDAEILEQLIAQRVQEHQNACSLVRMTIDRVELTEIRDMQEGTLSPPDLQPVEQVLISPQIDLTFLGDNVYRMDLHPVDRNDGAFAMVKPFDPSGMVTNYGNCKTTFGLGAGACAITLRPTGQPGPIPYDDHGLVKDLPKDHPWFAGNSDVANVRWDDLEPKVPAKFDLGSSTHFIGGHTVVGEVSLACGPTSFPGFKGIDFSNPNLTAAAPGLLSSLLTNLPIGSSISDNQATYVGVDANGQAVPADYRPLEPIFPGSLVHDFGSDESVPVSRL